MPVSVCLASMVDRLSQQSVTLPHYSWRGFRSFKLYGAPPPAEIDWAEWPNLVTSSSAR